MTVVVGFGNPVRSGTLSIEAVQQEGALDVADYKVLTNANEM